MLQQQEAPSSVAFKRFFTCQIETQTGFLNEALHYKWFCPTIFPSVFVCVWPHRFHFNFCLSDNHLGIWTACFRGLAQGFLLLWEALVCLAFCWTFQILTVLPSRCYFCLLHKHANVDADRSLSSGAALFYCLSKHPAAVHAHKIHK